VVRAAQEAQEAGHEGSDGGQGERVHFAASCFACTAFCATLPTM
jgi:hypothetical protein